MRAVALVSWAAAALAAAANPSLRLAAQSELPHLATLLKPGTAVTVHVYSGTRDPTFVLDADGAAAVFSAGAAHAATLGHRVAPPHRLGYRGFGLSVAHGQPVLLTVYGHEGVEQELLERAIEAGAVLPVVADHIRGEAARVTAMGDYVERPVNVTPAPPPSNCAAPVVGSDAQTVYVPASDDCGFFVQHQPDNNCYNYGTDVATNTFAQPGRGSGHHWRQDTCESIRAAAESDGLVWSGTELPQGQPAGGGHYMALFIWPNTNFHWARLDADTGTWSHKPGGSQVRNVDNDRKTITDPSKCNMAPWSQFCGYMTVVPSQVCGAGRCIN